MPKLPLPLEGKLTLRKLMATGLDQARNGDDSSGSAGEPVADAGAYG